MKPPYAIGSVPSLSGYAIAYRWRSLPRVRRHRASKPQGSSERVLPWQITMDQLIFASLSHTHYWYEVGMLKVPAYVQRECSAEPSMRRILLCSVFHLSPVLAYYFLSRCNFSTSTDTSTPLYSFINNRLYAQNPVFEIVREESVKVYLQMYSGNVQQNPLCVESCFTKEYSISPGSRQRCSIL